MEDRFRELTIVWLRKAKEDFLWVSHDFREGFYGIVCFGCQQIAEKALKAYLFSQKEKLIKTHNLIKLLKKCSQHQSSFGKLLKVCKILNNYYTDTRYPDIWDYDRFNDKKLASEALKLAEEVLKSVKSKINP
jgi:HEPN domain-containing protein